MLNHIIQFSIKNKLIIGIFILFLIGYGTYQFTKLPIDAVPDITDNQVQVITITPALGAPDVERLITFPIEQVNSNIPGLKQIRSFSRFGLSVVTIVFDDNVDVYWARQQVTERLQQVQDEIPDGFGTPELAPVTTGLGEIYQYSIRAKKGYENRYTAMDFRTIQDWIVRRQLIGVRGVADVSSFGGYLKQYEIAVDPARLNANNITINDIFSALENNNQNTGGAYIEKGPTVLFIRSEGLVGSFDDIENIGIKSLLNGAPLLIRDVAEVRLGSATRYGAMTHNGQGEVSGAVVMMLKGANSNEVIDRIKERIIQIQKTLPEGIVIDPFLDRTKMVNSAIGTVERNLLEAVLIVIFVLVLFLGNLRGGLLIASVIPLAMLFAVIMMNLFGVSGNLMSLGALDFGLIVDGAVILVEAVLHRLTHSKHFSHIDRLTQPEMDAEANHSVSRIMNSAVFGQIIILIVYLPIFTLQGIEGKMFKPMAYTVVFALAGAFILSLTYVPMMSALLLSKKITHKKTISDRMMNRLERVYQHTLEKVLRFPKTIIISSILLFSISIFVMLGLGGEFIPSLEEGDFAVETRVLTGSNLGTSMNAVSTGARILLEKFPEVEQVVGKTGSSEIPTDPMPIDASDMMIILKDKREWTSAKTFPELEAKMSKELEAIPGVTFGFQYPVQMRFNELISGARQDVVCKIFGEDLDTLAYYAKILGEICNTVEGSSGVYVEAVTGMPQIVIKYNRAVISQYGLNIVDVNKVVNTAFAGQSSGLVYEGEKRFDLVVRLSGEQRKDLIDVQNLLIPTQQGIQIPLNQIAKVDIIEGPNQIQREDAQRRIIIGFNVRGRDVQSMVKELQEKAESQMQLPAGYYITYGGAFENLVEAKKRLGIAVPVALALIFLMLYFTFNSVRQGLIVYSAIPLSAIGGIFALALFGIPFSISAGVGFIALFGVAVLNGIILIAEFNRLKTEGMDDLYRIVIQGTKIRLRSVLMTGAVPALGFLPMAISQGAGAAVQRPLATVVIGGLFIATLLTLFVLPVLYTIFENGIGFKRKNFVRSSTSVIIIILFVSTNDSIAQSNTSFQGTPITLQEGIDMALKNNLSLRNEKLNTDYLLKLRSTALDIPQTNVSFGYGQINSSYGDNMFSIGQSIKFPAVYKRQKSLYNEEWKAGLMNVAIKETELKKEVIQVYAELRYMLEKRKLLEHIDTIYSAFLETANLRLRVGEANILEKITAESQHDQIQQQLVMLQQDFIMQQAKFKLLLNTTTDFYPADINFKLPVPLIADSSIVAQHPYILHLQQQQQINLARINLEKAKLLPDLFASYNSMTIKGVGPDNILYTGKDRFHSVEIGVGVSIFRHAVKSGISAMELNLDWSRQNYSIGLQTLRSEYQQAVEAYHKYVQAVEYYETKALKNAETIMSTANLQFQNGEINYLEWVMLTNNAINIQSEYIEAIKNLNESIIDLNSFITR